MYNTCLTLTFRYLLLCLLYYYSRLSANGTTIFIVTTTQTETIVKLKVICIVSEIKSPWDNNY